MQNAGSVNRIHSSFCIHPSAFPTDRAPAGRPLREGSAFPYHLCMLQTRAAKPKQPAPPAARRAWPAAAVLFAITVVAYLPALRAGFIWDDDAYVTNNPTLRTATDLWRI